MNSTYCAAAQGVVARPASHTHFNQRPQGVCRTHPQYIQYAVGCSIHRGVLLGNLCELCIDEQRRQQYINVLPIQSTVGYPGDANM
jgi:hypothetical protein